MRQIVQNPKSGALELAEVPPPSAGEGRVLVRNHFSVVSPGTEKMALEFARKSLLGKARSRPDLVRQVARKLQQEGPLPTYRAVMTRLDAPQPLGYSSAGVVVEAGPGVEGLAPGDRVACAGAGYANHAEFVAVPENLVARVPEGLELHKAAFATLGAIAMQGLRVAGPRLGERVAVIGLGMIGQLTVQLLRANGCRVLAVDLSPDRVAQAIAQGAEWGASPGDDAASWIASAADGYGADAAIVTAASESSAPIQLAADLCRAKGVVVAVGSTAMDLDRRSFYDKELELRMSMSYGPGRYDRRYEEVGLDYPITYVRWTENRNLQAFLALAATGAIDPDRLGTESVEFADAVSAYSDLAAGRQKALAVVFRYGAGASFEGHTLPLGPKPRPIREQVGVSFVGAGNYAKGVLLPAVAATRGVQRVAIATATGPSARQTGEKYRFSLCSTDASEVIGHEATDLVFVATQHDTHASLAAAALRAGKAVWLEKPAALDEEQLGELADAARETGGFLTVGYNRRFSPHSRAIAEHFAARSAPLAIHYTVAAGPTPTGTWHLDPAVGGGRILGEVCHFVDLCVYLVGRLPSQVHARALSRDAQSDDSVAATLAFPDGSVATLHYLARTSAELPKERFEVSGGGRTALCDNFRTTRLLGGRTLKTRNQDKGQRTAVAETIDRVRQGEPSPIPLEEIVGVSRTTFALSEARWADAAIEVSSAPPSRR